jgi:adenine/guanine phosphoribosyltransferase-like PRPP-binding protein
MADQPVGERPTYHAVLGSQSVELPIVRLTDELAIALLITVDLGLDFCDRAGTELAASLSDLGVEVVVSIATMGIPVALEVTRRLGLNEYVVLHKTPKIHLADAVSEPVRSVTTATPQHLLLDRARVGVVAGRRAAVIDDVISTGASAAAALRLLRGVAALPVAIGAIAAEGHEWRATLGDDAGLVHALGELPLFEPLQEGGFRPRASR